MTRNVNEPIDALVVYRRGAPHPLLHAFRWRDERYKVSETFFVHQERNGENTYLCYSVGSGRGRYELRLDTGLGRWMLEAVDAARC